MKIIESGNVNIVIIITRGDAIGGAHIHVKDIAVALQKLGNTVTILVGEEGDFTGMLAKLNIKYQIVENLVREINFVTDIKAVKEIRALLQEIKPDLVTLHSSKAGILGRIAVYLEKIPSTFTVHGWAFTEGVAPKKQLFYKVFEKMGALFPTRLITVSKYDRKIALDQNVCKSEKITAIQNGMPDIEQKLFADPSITPPKLIMVARFEQQKDHKTLVAALSELKDLPWELDLVGSDGGHLAGIEVDIKRFGLEDKIHILGYRSDIDELMASSQIFILSSNWEGFPLTILEAMRAKLPVIASSVGGVSEAVINDETGYLIHTKEELVNGLKKLITDPSKCVAMGLQGRENYNKYFTVEIQLENTFKLYNELLANE